MCLNFLLQQKSSHLVEESSELKPFSSSMDITDNSVKLLNAHSSLAQHHYNLSRSIFLKRSRHHYSHQYSRRNSGSHGSASSSHGKGTPLHDERLSFKLASQCNTEPGHHIGESEMFIFNLLNTKAFYCFMEGQIRENFYHSAKIEMGHKTIFFY